LRPVRRMRRKGEEQGNEMRHSSKHWWTLAAATCAVCAIVAPAAAQQPNHAAQIGEIMRVAAQPELPLIKTEVIPLQATSRMRQRLGEQGRAQGLGKDWNPAAAEWREAEERVEPRVREALKAPASPENARKLEACLKRLDAEELDGMLVVLHSDLWARYRRAVDLTGAMFALMGEVDAALVAARDALSRRVTEMAEREMSGNLTAEVQRRFSTRGTTECSQMLITDTLSRTGALMQHALAQIDRSQSVFSDAALKFKTRTRKS